MELVNIFRAVMLYMSNVKPENQSVENISEFSELGLTHPPPTLSIINSLPVVTDNAFSNNENEYKSYGTKNFVPYDNDCALPFLPSFVSGKFPDEDFVEKEESNLDRSSGNKRSSEQTNRKQTNLEKADPKQPNPEQSAAKQQYSKHLHTKATFSIPIHVVHELPDSELSTLHRFEDYCEDKIFDVYTAIKDFNNYNYEKNQEIQYVSYKEERKQEMIDQSKKKKAQIKSAYNKMHQVCDLAERHREQITKVLNPFLQTALAYFAQPLRVPKLWYDIHNLETVIQQLFTPKLKFRMHLFGANNDLCMSRIPIDDPTRKEFIPLPKVYLNETLRGDGGESVDGTSIIRENSHPDTRIQLFDDKKSRIQQQFNDNVLEQYTYSTNKEIQQIIIYYVYKYYELKVRDGTRKVFFFTRQLKNKRKSGGIEIDFSALEDQIAEAMRELQEDTIELERNRVVPELIGLYNAENEVHNLLPDTNIMTKLIGKKNKRVITAFNPSEAIKFHELEPMYQIHKRVERTADESTKTHDEDFGRLEEPLYWDQNWTWDF